MWSVIVGAVGGVILTVLVVLVKGYSASAQSESNSKAAQERLDRIEKQLEADSDKRVEKVKDEADKINASGSAADALDQLRKQFPGASGTSSN